MNLAKPSLLHFEMHSNVPPSDSNINEKKKKSNFTVLSVIVQLIFITNSILIFVEIK